MIETITTAIADRGESAQASPTSLRNERTLQALSQALKNRDVKAFLATLHEDVVYALNHEGFEPARGHDEVVIAWDLLMQAFPDIRFENLGIVVRDDLAVEHWRMTGTLSAPWPLGSKVAIPDGSAETVCVRGVDVFRFADDGRILRKDAFVDVGGWFEAYGRFAAASSS